MKRNPLWQNPWLMMAAPLGLSACVTINVYFPAAAAEAAADRIIEEVWGGSAPPAAPAAPAAPSSGVPDNGGAWLSLLDFVVPAAQAQEPNLDVSSPEIKRLTGAMEARHTELSRHYASGVVGLTADGYVALRDPAPLPLAERNAVRALVGNENADRAALYREIALANGQPQWAAQIRAVFAARWIARAQPGWYYQDASGAWLRK